MPHDVSVTVWGEHALFTRPELSVERLSYPFMTPSAARGMLDAILFKPQMRWHVRRITVTAVLEERGTPETKILRYTVYKDRTLSGGRWCVTGN